MLPTSSSLYMNVSSVQRNILETLINYPGIVPTYCRSTPLSINQVLFSRYATTQCFTIIMNKSESTPCIIKSIRTGIITVEDLENDKSCINKINMCQNKENTHHKVSKVSFLIIFDKESGKRAYTLSNCDNPLCKVVMINLETNKEKTWNEINWDLTNALFNSGPSGPSGPSGSFIPLAISVPEGIYSDTSTYLNKLKWEMRGDKEEIVVPVTPVTLVSLVNLVNDLQSIKKTKPKQPTGNDDAFKAIRIIPDMNVQQLDGGSMLHLFPLKGGKVLNFIDKTVRKRVSNDLFTFECPVNYVPMKKENGFPNAIKFFSSISPGGDMELVKYYQTMLGYCLTGETSNRNLYVNWGGEGKSTLWKIMAKILDKFLVTCLDCVLNDIDNSKVVTPELCTFVGARVVLLSETKKSKYLNNLITKKVVDGEIISARQSTSQQFEFTPVCKLVMMTNKSPRTFNQNDLVYNSVKFVEFSGHLEKSKESEKYVQSLLNEHLDEIFSFLVEGAHEYYVKRTLI